MNSIVGVSADGGASFCAVCNGSLTHSWVVTFTDKPSENRCSLHLDDA
jgi:hypothetical protein